MEKLTIKQQKEVLNSMLKSLKFDDKYFIEYIYINKGTRYTIAYKYIINDNTGIYTTIHMTDYMTDYMTYDQMQKWFLGYRDGLEKKFSK